jgi:pimeloyl-ACP methyl ester carboxylesterase
MGLLTDIADEAEIVESVIRHAGGPVHLVGHSFGGLVALATALRGRVPLLSLTVMEAPAAELLRHSGEEAHYRAFRDMTGAYFAAYYAGETEAIASMIDFYGGPGTFASWPRRVRDYAVATTQVNIVDWADGYGFKLTPARLKAIDIPTLVLWGGKSHPAVQRANALLGLNTPGATVAVIPDAAHFMISTHPQEVARILAGQLSYAEVLNRSAAA